ncbi:MAG: hypothetical protein IT310_05515 [Anaerolineales bacterium]|nr:hypothetical protein [Anaerolineales bacterium]
MQAEKDAPQPPRQPDDWQEIPIFIHGISPDKYPNSGVEEYEELLRLVKKQLKEYPDKKFNADPLFITWGVPNKDSSASLNQHLADVERKIQEKVKARMGGAYSNPFGITGHLRDLLFYGMSDLFYYLSPDGEEDLREQIFGIIAKEVKKINKKDNERVSMTIFGHSAGSVIAHDLLFHLFSRKRSHTSEVGKMKTNMDHLRDLIGEKRLRVRRLYTFGSPLSLLMLRAKALIYKIHEEEPLHPSDLGLDTADDLSDPRWVNFWSRHDLVSYPVDFLYDNKKGLIEDHEISTSISPTAAHTGYWTSEEMAKHVAKTF